MVLDNCSNAWRATLAHFYGVPIKYFVELAALWEVLIYEAEELASNVCRYTFVEWWVEP